MIDGVIVIFFIWFVKKNKRVTSLQAKDLNRFAYPSNNTHIVINKRKKENMYLKKFYSVKSKFTAGFELKMYVSQPRHFY